MARGKTTWKDVWKEVVIFATAIAVAAAAWILISGLNRRAREKAQMEMERQRMLAAESEANREKAKMEREEAERKARERREKELAERKAREAEEKRIRDEKDGHARRYAAFMDGFRRVKLDYWRNAPAEEKRLRKEEECVYVCFVAHPVEGNVLIETKSHPGEKLKCARMFPDRAPVPMSEKDYNAYIRGGTYFVVRSIADQPADTAYLSFGENEGDERREMIGPDESFNPSRIELKGLYDAFGTAGASRAPNFNYVVYIHLDGETKGREVCDAAFGDEIPREAFAGFVSQLVYNRKLAAWRPKTAPKKSTVSSSLKTMKNNSTIPKTTLGGKHIAGEYHGTSSSWISGHYISRSSYRCKVYTHWKELAAYREELEAERKRSVGMSSPEKPRIVVSDDEVEKTLAKAKLSFKVVKP